MNVKEECQDCHVKFKHHELVRHRKLTGHVSVPLNNTLIKAKLRRAKRAKIRARM